MNHKSLFDFLIIPNLLFPHGKWKMKWHPSNYFSLGAKGLIPFLLVTILSFYSLTNLKRDYSLTSDFPENHNLLERIEEEQTHFMSNGDFILIMSPEFSSFNEIPLQNMEQVIEELQELPEVALVVSPLNLPDLYDDGYSWSFRSIAELPLTGQEDVSQLYETIRETDLFRKVFLGKQNEPGLYVFPVKGISREDFGGALIKWSLDNPEAPKLTGLPVLKYYYNQMVSQDTRRLPLLALVLILIIEFLIYRKIKIALYLGLASLVPMIWSLALFPVINLTMSMDNLIAPILVLGLASSYGIHLIRGRSVFPDCDMDRVLEKISGKIVIAGLTTMMGFGALLLSPTSSIRQFGFILILGIVFALIFSLFALPVILKRTPLPTDHGEKLMARLHKPTGKRKNLIQFFGLILLLLYGFTMVYMDSRILNLLPGYHSYHENNRYFNEHFGGVNELEILCDTGIEYGLVSEEYYQKVSHIISSIESLPSVSAAIGYSDFVKWMHSRTVQGGEKIAPYTDPDLYFIGESLEMLSDNSAPGLQINTLVDPSYRYHRILVRFESEQGRSGWNDYESLMNEINAHLSRVELGTVTVGGASVIQYYLINSHKQTIFKGLILFFPVLILICLILTRSLIWTFCIISSPVLGALVYFGSMGLLGIPLTIPTLLSITCILGVSVDDNIFYTFSVRGKLIEGKDFKTSLRESYQENGGAILDTSVTIIFVMFCLFASGNRAIIQSGFLIILSQALTTIYTLWFLPLFFPRKQCLNRKMKYIQNVETFSSGDRND